MRQQGPISTAAGPAAASSTPAVVTAAAWLPAPPPGRHLVCVRLQQLLLRHSEAQGQGCPQCLAGSCQGLLPAGAQQLIPQRLQLHSLICTSSQQWACVYRIWQVGRLGSS